MPNVTRLAEARRQLSAAESNTYRQQDSNSGRASRPNGATAAGQKPRARGGGYPRARRPKRGSRPARTAPEGRHDHDGGTNDDGDRATPKPGAIIRGSPRAQGRMNTPSGDDIGVARGRAGRRTSPTEHVRRGAKSPARDGRRGYRRWRGIGLDV